MFSKLTLGAIVATSALADLSTARDPEAPPPTQADHRYEVLVLHDEEGWQVHGTYRLRAEARRDAIRLWHDGYRVVIWDF